MSLHRRSDGRLPGTEEVRPAASSAPVAYGTLACPACDAPVALLGRRMRPAEALTCSFCEATGTVRDFLSLGIPTRTTRVAVRVARRLTR